MKHPSDFLSRVALNRVLIQDFVPLCDSIQWRLGQEYWRRKGSSAFIQDDVPYLINNDGYRSSCAAKLLLASLDTGPKPDNGSDKIFVLELGVGTGNFASLFLDEFANLCAITGRSYYDRLCYLGVDHSEEMLLDLCSYGVLRRHPGRYALRCIDATCLSSLMEDLLFEGACGRPFQAVFLNYVLDCLAPSVLRSDSHGHWSQLCVRTSLPHERASGTDMSAISTLIEQLKHGTCDYEAFYDNGVNERWVAELAYRRITFDSIPYLDVAIQYASENGLTSVVHNHDALRCLDTTLELLKQDGFILINDYASPETAIGDQDPTHDTFGGSTAIGINYPLIRKYLRDVVNVKWIEPASDDENICTRVVGWAVSAYVEQLFHDSFDGSAIARTQETIKKARGAAAEGHIETALAFYITSLKAQPFLWTLLAEASEFVMLSFHDLLAAEALLLHALFRNPTGSGHLWNTLGSVLMMGARQSDAVTAFSRAFLIDSMNVQALINLAEVVTKRGEFDEALELVSSALKTGRIVDHWEQASTLISRIVAGKRDRKQEIERFRRDHFIWTEYEGVGVLETVNMNFGSYDPTNKEGNNIL